MPRGDRSPRGAHAERVRTALLEAALQLFGAYGYDATSTDEIAEAAGVSPRTFFRYFPTKESVLFSGEFDFIRAFGGVYLAQPDSISDFQAMEHSFALLAPALKRIRTRISQYYDAIASSAVLLGREQQNHTANIDVIAKIVAERRGLPAPNEECELLASVGMLLLTRAINRWLNTRGQAVEDLIRQEFAALPGILK
ncbi:TetR family transcriptional regulator [Mycobacterium seoulense]|uniref:TetR family transcriptional regulator n=1 Tax=Mycobacterium seoulense TaxID=386911 RepID=A0A7I7P144_9MYCO|nr:TetR family transcriptional regulator [Mycobacterium seoulense]MCV7437509.1 TetR family transcriptional regulator [Mycobacterium seoulense]OBH09117.1 TetR family transcriptional regulator [Mycobacterium sp. E3247]OBH29139.1 TetR family transcriptional regulator [Mycobacterium sp. E342]BBY02485.1 TetR family transcriptional regulator [Mycobacterium seoulense]